jgi:3-dehydroquinate synthase
MRNRSGQSSELATATRIPVQAERPYEVLVGHSLLGELPTLLDARAAAGQTARVAVIHPPTLINFAERIVHLLTAAGKECVRIDVPDAEVAKTVDIAAHCWSVLGTAGFTRSDAVLGVGGGATTDLAGFVAATWLRGVTLVNVPTSVLGMVDAAVGGKTGINTAEGKNLVGCLYEPAGVVCDLDALASLPRPELVGGLAEVIKCGFIADPQILTALEAEPASALRPDSALLRSLIERAIAVKARVVSADLRELTSTGSVVGREQLNYGHTLGHAIERRERYRARHGEAVSIGMVFAAELASRAGRLDSGTVARHRRILSLVGLPTTYDPDAFDELLNIMSLDKKTRGSTLRFVVLSGVGQVEILSGPAEELLREAYAAVARPGT